MMRCVVLILFALISNISFGANKTTTPSTNYTSKDIMNTACHVGCRKEGFDAGFYIQKGFCEELSIVKIYYNKKQCACLTVLDFNDVTGKSFPKSFSSGRSTPPTEQSNESSDNSYSTPLYFPRFSTSYE